MQKSFRVTVLAILVISLICTILLFKQYVQNKNMQLRKIENKISNLKEYVDFLETELSYVTSPQNIENMYSATGRLNLIKENQIISRDEFYILIE